MVLRDCKYWLAVCRGPQARHRDEVERGARGARVGAWPQGSLPLDLDAAAGGHRAVRAAGVHAGADEQPVSQLLAQGCGAVREL